MEPVSRLSSALAVPAPPAPVRAVPPVAPPAPAPAPPAATGEPTVETPPLPPAVQREHLRPPAAPLMTRDQMVALLSAAVTGASTPVQDA